MQIRMGEREYDPALGRFASVDPLRGTPSDPQQRNRYTYTGNNPLVRYDLNGLYWGEDWIEGAWDTTNTIYDFTPWGIRSDIEGAALDFGKNYIQLQWKDEEDFVDNPQLDKYYHCKANYEATARGFGGKKAGEFFSWLREEVNLRQASYKDIPLDKAEIDKQKDLSANERGVQACEAGLSLEEACGMYLDQE